MTLRYPIIWLFGLSSSGKTTLAEGLRDKLESEGQRVAILDGDALRAGLCSDLDFSEEARSENLRRAAEIAKVLANQGFVVVCAFITPKGFHRNLVRRILGSSVLLVYVDCPLKVCMTRDVKGLYTRALAGGITGMTGIHDSFDSPADYDVHVGTNELNLSDCIFLLRRVLSFDEALPAS